MQPKQPVMMDGVKVKDRKKLAVDCSSVPDTVKDFSIGCLHIGIKTQLLVDQKISTIGHLIEAWPLEPDHVEGMGSTTFDLIVLRLNALVASVTTDGAVNWEEYCRICGITLIPLSKAPETGQELIEALDRSFVEIADHISDEVDADILRSRILKMPGQQKTLEQIGQAAVLPITRERVRQKEEKLIRELSNALLTDFYVRLNVHFRFGFARWWQIAAAELNDFENRSFDDFVSSLSKLWDVDVPSLVRQLPIIWSILAGTSRLPEDFRIAIMIHPSLYGELREEVSNLPFRRLRLDQHVRRLEDDGIHTIKDFVDLSRNGRIGYRSTLALSEACRHVNMIAHCFDDNGVIDWALYQKSIGIEPFPKSSTADVTGFLINLPENLEKLIDRLKISRRATEIFKFRTSQLARNRPTLSDAADRLNTHGPTIKREESVLLEYLNAIFVKRRYNLLPVWLDASWLQYWKEAARVFSTSRYDFDTFNQNLLKRWQLNNSEPIEQAVAILWAVFSGYPNGRPRRSS